MKNSIIAVVAVAGLASAQFSGIPECAQGCLTTAISSAGCPITDVGCQCSSTAEIQGFGAGCILGACTAPGELNSAIEGGLGLCKSYLATVSASATASAASSSAASASATATATAVETSTVTAETTSIPAPTNVPIYGTNYGGNSTVIAPTGGAPSPSGTPAPVPSQIPVGGASNLAIGLGGFFALFIGVAAVAL